MQQRGFSQEFPNHRGRELVQRRNDHHNFLLLLISLWRRKVNKESDSSQSGNRYGLQ